jgi:AAA+ superfamily predicted ATPase
MTAIVTEASLSAARAVARAYLASHPIEDAAARRSVETFITVYEAIRTTIGSHNAAIFIASKEAVSGLSVAPERRKYSYPSSPAVLLAKVPVTQGALAGYFQSLQRTSEEKLVEDKIPDVVSINDKQYSLRKKYEEVFLVGLDKEVAILEKYVRQLFLFDPLTSKNSDIGRFPKTVLLTGPPGSGKSSLIKHMVAIANYCASISTTKCKVSLYDASNFSSYFGRSTRILKRKLEDVQNPSGVGIFCIEDADMVLQSRDDSQVFHGVLELQQYLMNHLSGVHTYRGNTLTILTTNKPNSLDIALVNRLQARFLVNPFAKVESHARYFAQMYPALPIEERCRIAAITHEFGFSGRDLESVLYLSQEATTSIPTDEEIISKERVRPHQSISASVLERIIVEHRAALHSSTD